MPLYCPDLKVLEKILFMVPNIHYESQVDQFGTIRRLKGTQKELGGPEGVKKFQGGIDRRY